LAVGNDANGGVGDRLSEDGVNVGRIAQASNGVVVRSWFMGLVGKDAGGVTRWGRSAFLVVT
jgi:hypothetical protein